MQATADRAALIDARFAFVILTGMAARGFDTDRVLRRARLDPDALRQPNARITQGDLARLVATMTRLSRDEFWGLLSRPIKPGSFRMLCRILIRSRDLRAALIDGCRFCNLLVDDFTLRFIDDGRVARITIVDRPIAPHARAAVHGPVMFFVFGLMCWLVGRKIPLIAVRHAFAMAPHSTALRTFYQAPQSFEFSRSELEFDTALLTLPIMPDEQRLSRFLASVPSALLVRFRDNASFAERVRSLLQRDLARDISREEIADILMVTPQTLRRRLIEEGAEGFRTIKDRVRSAAAVDLLTHTERPVEEIAFGLGFSDVSAFHRAFRRWTGRTPGDLRQGGA